jgi:hypothetical protein
MNQDEEQLRLLSIFHYVCAGLAAFVACFPIIHLVIGMVLLLNPNLFATPNAQPHPEVFVALMFVVMASVFIVLGWTFAACVAYAGRCLARRKKYTFCIVMAGVLCLFMPFGTILGVFSIIVLMRPTVKTLFTGVTSPVVAK